MIFGKHINKYYKKYFWLFFVGILTLIIVDVIQMQIPYYLGKIVDNNQLLITDTSSLTNIIINIIVCALIMAIGRVLFRLTIFKASTGIEAGLRAEMFLKSEKMSVSYYRSTKVGTIMSWFANDIETVGEFYGWGTVMLVDAFFLSIIAIVAMFKINVFVALVALIPIALIAVWGALVEKFMAMKWKYRQEAYDELYDFTNENFTGIRVIKAFVKETKEIHKFAKIARKNKDANISFAKTSILFDVLIELIIDIEVCLILGLGGYFIYMTVTGNPINLFGQEVQLTVGELMAFIGYIDILIWPMIALGQIVMMRSRTKVSLQRIGHFLDEKEEIQNSPNPTILKDVKGSIVFDHFSFKYPDSEVDSLKDISLEIKPGEMVGIVGKIGSGKSTLINSLLRLYNVHDKSILIDGNNLMDIDLDSLRESVAFAPQDNFLFSGPIEENIAFAGDKIDSTKVIEAAKFADIDDNIQEFPNKYQTISGERGVTLSGGQKQRVSLARAYYKNSPILLLDDSLSSVDVKTEENILENIKKYRSGKTTIVASSRVSTIANFDRIIVLNDGKVEAFDNHNNLLKISPTYKRMVDLQKLEQEKEAK